jgi:hypothetical protein
MPCDEDMEIMETAPSIAETPASPLVVEETPCSGSEAAGSLSSIIQSTAVAPLGIAESRGDSVSSTAVAPLGSAESRGDSFSSTAVAQLGIAGSHEESGSTRPSSGTLLDLSASSSSSALPLHSSLRSGSQAACTSPKSPTVRTSVASQRHSPLLTSAANISTSTSRSTRAGSAINQAQPSVSSNIREVSQSRISISRSTGSSSLLNAGASMGGQMPKAAAKFPASSGMLKTKK